LWGPLVFVAGGLRIFAVLATVSPWPWDLPRAFFIRWARSWAIAWDGTVKAQVLVPLSPRLRMAGSISPRPCGASPGHFAWVGMATPRQAVGCRGKGFRQQRIRAGVGALGWAAARPCTDRVRRDGAAAGTAGLGFGRGG